MGKGWILLHRKIRECSVVWDDKPFSRGQAWIDLLMMVNHEDKDIFFDGGVHRIERGQKLTSIRKLSEEWGWSRTKTTKFLNDLEKAEMLTVKSDTKKTVVTIVNYDSYQDLEKIKEPPKSHRKATEKPQKDTNKELINNYINNSNNINTPLPPTGEQKDSYSFDSHSNVENVKHILNNGLFDKWQYIKANPKLWECIKGWMAYKDEKKPKTSNHYSGLKSIRTLLNKFVSSCEDYGSDEVIRVVDMSIAASYMGIVWEKMSKKASEENFEDIH